LYDEIRLQDDVELTRNLDGFAKRFKELEGTLAALLTQGAGTSPYWSGEFQLNEESISLYLETCCERSQDDCRSLLSEYALATGKGDSYTELTGWLNEIRNRCNSGFENQKQLRKSISVVQKLCADGKWDEASKLIVSRVSEGSTPLNRLLAEFAAAFGQEVELEGICEQWLEYVGSLVSSWNSDPEGKRADPVPDHATLEEALKNLGEGVRTLRDYSAAMSSQLAPPLEEIFAEKRNTILSSLGAAERSAQGVIDETHLDLSNRHAAETIEGKHPWHWVCGPGLHNEQCDRLIHYMTEFAVRLVAIQRWIEESKLPTAPGTLIAMAHLVGKVVELGARPEESKHGLWELALRPDSLRQIDVVLEAHRLKVEADSWLRGTVPNVFGKEAAAQHDLSELGLSYGRVFKQTSPPNTAFAVSLRRDENSALLSQLDAAYELLSRLQQTIPLDSGSGSDSLLAAATVMELGGAAPKSLLSKPHLLGQDGKTEDARQKIGELGKINSWARRTADAITQPLDALDLEVIKVHRDTLGDTRWFRVLTRKYWSSVSYSKTLSPHVTPESRWGFFDELVRLLEAREKLSRDKTLAEIFPESYRGLETDIEEIKCACDWVDEARRSTPITGRQSISMRRALFSLTHDIAELCKQLVEKGWPKTFRTLAERCTAQRTRLEDLSLSLEAEQSALETIIVELARLGWLGELSQSQIASASSQLNKRVEADEVIGKHPGVLEVLLPDSASATECVRTIHNALQKIKTLPISNDWRTHLSEADSSSAWIDLEVQCAKLRIHLAEAKEFVEKINVLASVAPNVRSFWDAEALSKLERGLRDLMQKGRELTTRAHLLASTQKLSELGLDKFVNTASAANIEEFSNCVNLFRCIYMRSLAYQAFDEHPTLAEFRHSSPSQVRTKFSQLDDELKALHRRLLVSRLLERRAPRGNDTGLISERSQLGLLEHVAFLEKPRTSVRDLLRRAGTAMQSIKPCFMMSPLSVAQLIERGTLEFDVVVFDEASQIRPEDAMSAMARAKQFVVVGDQMQLPPTSFGEKSFGEDQYEEDDAVEIEESAAVESILELASAAYGNSKTLLWHYRSRDPSLIAFSNKEFYQNRLMLFPCPSAKSLTTGVKYVWVGGKYSARTNVEEARTCAAAAIESIRHYPDKSLGIVALNRPQADLIQLELDRLFHDNPGAEAYRAKWESSLEPLFVKNLETVQGDERDIVFVSTVFGEDDSGRFFQRFGPINSNVGHRRLNVLFTRAKHQLVVFTSLPPEKIVASETSNWGIRAFKSYLNFARTGSLETGRATGKSEDSPFEVGVRAALESVGFKCEPQVGVAGFFIDLGVIDPRSEDLFLAGVECDGAAYHSTPSARDRDRLRQSVLESFGWKIYRIWSTDWFTDPHAQLQKLANYLRELKAAPLRAADRGGIDFSARFGKKQQLSEVKDGTAVGGNNGEI
jgi:very-short-patch-repair endonuclease